MTWYIAHFILRVSLGLFIGFIMTGVFGAIERIVRKLLTKPSQIR